MAKSSPDQTAVIYRTLCLGALVMRANLESSAAKIASLSNGSLSASTKLSQALDEWIAKNDLNHYISSKETILLKKPFGSWSERETIDGSWRTECMGVMAWALSLLDSLLPYDTQFSGPKLLHQVGIGLDPTNLHAKARLRSLVEISRMRDAAELWRWRARTSEVQKRGVVPPGGLTFQEITKKSAELAFKAGFIPKPIEDDFPLFRKSCAKLTEEEWQMATSIAQERHLALNWLCGQSSSWDETPTDT